MKLRRWEWGLIASVFLADQILALYQGTRFCDYSTPLIILGVAFLLLLYAWIRQIEKFIEIGEYVLLWVCFVLVNAISAYVVAGWRLPLRDAELAGIDAAIGFNRTALLRMLMASRWLRDILPFAYSSLFLQTILSTVYFALDGFSDRNRDLFRMGAIACIATNLISGIVPAIGPHPPLAPFQQALIDVRNGGWRLVSIGQMQGIVTFPSFHTTLAVLFVYAHRPPCRTFLPILALNLLMLIAIPFWGHHYFIDAVAGAALAVACIYAVRNWLTPRASVHLEPVPLFDHSRKIEGARE
jgi:PAP2 superfamily